MFLCVRALFDIRAFSANALQRRREKKLLFVSPFLGLKIHRRKKALYQRYKAFLYAAGDNDDDARQLATTKKQTKKRTTVEDLRHSVSFCSVRVLHHICGSFCAFPFRLFFSELVVSPFCLVLLALFAPPVVLKTDFFSGKRIWRRKAERRGS